MFYTNTKSTGDEFHQAIVNYVDDQVKKDPGLLTRDKSKSVALIEGSLNRSKLYNDVQKYVEKHTTKSMTLRSHVNEKLEEGQRE